ncbi:MAG: RNA polymerase sigma factor [Nannocystaceae bacterium]|nr:RNA polymerase sigma factor [Myxococcales bacterium]
MSASATSDVAQVLVENHRHFLRFLERRVATREAAEDILQSALARGIERSGELRDEERSVAWFYRLLRNALIDHYRHQDAERRALSRHLAEEVARGDADLALEQAVCQCFRALVDTLTPAYADVLRAVDLGEVSIADYAAGAAITANNARVRLHRARAALRKSLERMCGTCTTHGCLDCSCKSACSST